MLIREEVRDLALASKDRLGLTWPQVGEAVGRSPVYAALLVYGYGQASAEEAKGLGRVLALPPEAQAALQKAPHRTPAQPWPPTDPFIYRLYEAVMLYGPVFKDVAHELFGDGIMSAIDMSVDIRKVDDPPGVPRMVLTLNGKWLQYKKFQPARGAAAFSRYNHLSTAFSSRFLSTRRLAMTLRTPCRLAWIVVLGATWTTLAQDKNPAITDPAKADADFAVQGEYVGELKNDDGKPTKFGVQVVAGGAGKFRALGYRGGLPGDGWDKSPKIESSGLAKDGVTEFPKFLGTAVLKNGILTVTDSAGTKRGELKRVLRQSTTQGAKPPAGALVLFDGTTADKFDNGKMTEDKLLMAGARSKQSFKDFTLHVEFRIPYQCKLNGNSGVFLQDMYEIQIIDWFGKEPGKGGNGAIYGYRSPDVNVSYPPLSWQTFDVQYTAAKFDADGKVKANPVVSMRHNGVVVHENYEMPAKATSGSKTLSPQGGPLYLQYYGGSPVHFRNIWVVEKK